MIKVTRLNGQQFYINADLIEFVEATPDTVITLFTGKKLVLADSVDKVIESIVAYKKMVGSTVIVKKAPLGDEV